MPIKGRFYMDGISRAASGLPEFEPHEQVTRLSLKGKNPLDCLSPHNDELYNTPTALDFSKWIN